MLLSVVIPMFNEESNVQPLYEELCEVLKQLKYFSDFEIVMVNDGSADGTLSLIKNLAHKDARIKVVSFIRNFGHEEATFAGLMHTKGDAVVLMDADRQDPPQLILEFEKEFKNGYDVVYAQRSKRLKESIVKKLTSKMFYPLFKMLTKVDMPRDVGDFSMLSRRCVDYVVSMRERSIFVRGLIYWVGLPKKAVPFVRRERGAGKSKFNYFYLSMAAIEHIVSYSVRPIYYIIISAALLFAVSFMATIAAAILYFAHPCFKWGICAFGSAMLWVFSIELSIFGLIGLYVARMFYEVKGRPRFIVGERVNCDELISKIG